MRWPWKGCNKPPVDAYEVADQAEVDARRRLAEAERVRDAARLEAANHREIRRRNHFGPIILGEIGRRR